MPCFKLATFNWGYAEDQRILDGPEYFHQDGFSNPAEVLESFRQAIITYLLSNKKYFMGKCCTKSLAVGHKHCPDCGKGPLNAPLVSEHEVVDFFDGMWLWTNDGHMDFHEHLQDRGWYQTWEIQNIETLPDEQKISFQRTNRWLEIPTDEDPLECIEDQEWCCGYSKGCSDWDPRDNAKWEAKNLQSESE